VCRTPRQAHDGNGKHDNAEGEMQADQRRHRRIAANVRHCPSENELGDQKRNNKPMQPLRGRCVTLRVCHIFLRP
jgi:hypothetical protein